MSREWVKPHQLDVPLCDLFPGTQTRNTARQYILIAEKTLNLKPKDVDRMGYIKLNKYIDSLERKIEEFNVFASIIEKIEEG